MATRLGATTAQTEPVFLGGRVYGCFREGRRGSPDYSREVPFGFLQHKPGASFDEARLLQAEKVIKGYRGDVEAYIASMYDVPPKEKRRRYRQYLSFVAAQSGAGNCDAMSTYAFMRFVGTAPHTFTVELAVFDEEKTGLDHVFLVLGRPPNTPQELCSQWTDETIILDAWLNQILVLGKMIDEWKKVFGLESNRFTAKILFDLESFMAIDTP